MNMHNKELVIEAGRAERQYWQDLWRYRELFYMLAWRDIAVRYKQTAIGFAWALIRPFLAIVVFSAVFGGCPIRFWSVRRCCPGSFLPMP
jgi:lipopolysaccharide transport system permease protein